MLLLARMPSEGSDLLAHPCSLIKILLGVLWIIKDPRFQVSVYLQMHAQADLCWTHKAHKTYGIFSYVAVHALTLRLNSDLCIISVWWRMFGGSYCYYGEVRTGWSGTRQCGTRTKSAESCGKYRVTLLRFIHSPLSKQEGHDDPV